MKEHELKTHSEYFNQLRSGVKDFELRKFDREFEVGDILVLREWKPDRVFSGGYTGQVLRKTNY